MKNNYKVTINTSIWVSANTKEEAIRDACEHFGMLDPSDHAEITDSEEGIEFSGHAYEITEQGQVLELNDQIDITGTSLQEEIHTTFEEIVDKLGNPTNDGDGCKIDAEWQVRTPDGVATIYNWKDGHNYNGEGGTPIREITEWHVGGKNKDVVKHIKNL